ncbi:MAG: hypothetical protein ACYC9R_12875 [Nitrosotalea sp.]
MTVVDPLAALQSVFVANVSYESDDVVPVTETYQNNGLDVEIFPFSKNKQRICPLITVGPIQHTLVRPQNIADSPNSRWLHKHEIECHLLTQTYATPNVSGYNAMVKIWESIRAILVQKQSTIDGSGNWLNMRLANGPFVGPDTNITPGRYDTVFVVELWRSVVN